jgi:hypothetical protein
MMKGQRSSKEAKKPKKGAVVVKPLSTSPAMPVVSTAVPVRPKKK